MPERHDFKRIFDLLMEWFDTPIDTSFNNPIGTHRSHHDANSSIDTMADFDSWRFQVYKEYSSGTRSRLPLKIWWPHYTTGDYRFELCIGALLVHQVSWRQVERSIQNIDTYLNESGLSFDIPGLHSIPQVELESLIRTTGFFRQKAKRILGFCNYVHENYDDFQTFMTVRRGGAGGGDDEPGTGETDGLQKIGKAGNDTEDESDGPLRDLGAELSNLKLGFGNETRDCVLLYAANVPVFVADAYSRRLLHMVGAIPENKIGDYDLCQDIYKKGIQRDFSTRDLDGIVNGFSKDERDHALLKHPRNEDIPLILLYQLFHAGIVELGISKRWSEFRDELQ